MTMIASSGNVIAAETAMSFDRVLESLRVDLRRHDFRILSEVDFSRELDSHIGLSASRYVVLIVWDPFLAYQALLSDPNGGLVIPFNLAVHQNGTLTTVSVLSQLSLTQEMSLGIRVLGQELNRRMRDLLMPIGMQDIRSDHRGANTAAALRGRWK